MLKLVKCVLARLMIPIPNVRTDAVEAMYVLTEEPVTRLVTSQARDSPAHASHTSREDFAKSVSLVQIRVLLDDLSDVACNLYKRGIKLWHVAIISEILLICNGSLYHV